MKKKKIKIEDIKVFLGKNLIDVYGDETNIFVDNVADVEHVNDTTLDWINPRRPNQQEIAENSPAKVMLTTPNVFYSGIMKEAGKVLLVVNNPRLTLSKIIAEFFVEKPQAMIHPTAVIDEEAIIDPSASIGAGCVIGRVRIGKGTVIKPNVVLYDDVIIGDNSLVHAGTVIGTDGLGCERETDGTLVKFPHIGGVVIGNNVEIGANCQIAKGVLSDTFIDDGCKINGLCFIAHNCHLEKNVWITGDTMLCGSTHVKSNTTIFSNVIIREQSTIGEKVIIGMGSVVTKDIPDGETWIGVPAHKLEKQ